MHVVLRVWCFSLVIMLGACEGSNNKSTKSTTSPNFHNDIAPILQKNCVNCHHEGGIAPFPLQTYTHAKNYRLQIAAQTRLRTMPPFLADNSGSCKTFQHALWLSDGEIATLNQWSQNPLEGTALVEPLVPVPADQLSSADGQVTTLQIPSAFLPAATQESPQDEHRCFVLDPALSESQYLTAFAVKPGVASMVHHVILFATTTEQGSQQATNLDNGDARLGYACFGGSGIASADVAMLAGWAPGPSVSRYPERTGVPIQASMKIIMQVHYNLASGISEDQTSVDLALKPASDTTMTPAVIYPLADLNMQLPPGEESAVADEQEESPVTGLIHGVFPHMHQLGKSLKVTRRKIGAADGASPDCLLNVPRWDFQWQQFYMYTQAEPVQKGDIMTLQCTYDTRGRTAAVTWGEGTQDEMCLNFFYVTQ